MTTSFDAASKTRQDKHSLPFRERSGCSPVQVSTASGGSIPVGSISALINAFILRGCVRNSSKAPHESIGATTYSGSACIATIGTRPWLRRPLAVWLPSLAPPKALLGCHRLRRRRRRRRRPIVAVTMSPIPRLRRSQSAPRPRRHRRQWRVIYLGTYA